MRAVGGPNYLLFLASFRSILRIQELSTSVAYTVLCNAKQLRARLERCCCKLLRSCHKLLHSCDQY